MAYDGTLRFLRYVTAAGVPTYLSPRSMGARPHLDHAFVFKCNVSKKDLKRLFAERPLVAGQRDVLPEHKWRARKVLPPALTPAQLRRLTRLLARPDVPLIAFPVTLVSTTRQCTDTPDRRLHQMVAVLNKSAATVEILDDLLPTATPLFGAKFLIDKGGIAQTNLLPKLQAALGPDATPLSVVVPRFHERHYRRLIETLAERGYAANNSAAHVAFTANYLRERAAHPSHPVAAVHDAVIARLRQDTAAFLACYDGLRATQPALCQAAPKRVVNPETRRCVAADGQTGRKVLGLVKKEEPKRAARAAPGPVNVHEHFLDSDVPDDYLSRMEIGANMRAAMAYLRDRYAIAAPTAHEFFWDTKTLKPPRDFKATWVAGMTDDAVRFIVMPVGLDGPDEVAAHANALIYDKTTRVLERFEPNGDGYADFNQAGLDAAVQAYFKDRIGGYDPPLHTCPVSFQRYDANEINFGAKSIGGNCAVWALYYMELRLSNPLHSRKEVVDAALKAIAKRGSFHMFINAYHRYVEEAMMGMRKK